MSALPLHFAETLSKSPELLWRLFTVSCTGRMGLYAWGAPMRAKTSTCYEL